jgi:tetratricopeptide (TPR) repeat protein
LGELDLADEWLRVAEAISPGDIILMFNRAEIERQRHGMEQYVAVYQAFSEKWPSRLNDGFLGTALLFAKDFAAARTALENNLLDEGQEGVVVNRDNFGFVDSYASTLMGLGAVEKAVELAEQSLAIYQQLRMEGVVYIFGAPVDLGIARMQIILGQESEALQALHSSYQSGFRDFQNLLLDPTFEPIKDDLGFTSLIQKMQADLAEQRQRLADGGHLLTPKQVLAMDL